MLTHLLYFKPYSLTQNLWHITSWIWILIKEPHSTLQCSPPGSGCGGLSGWWSHLGKHLSRHKWV